MGKYNLNEANDELIRSILLMKYDTKKTLTENEEEIKNKKSINEIAPLVIPAITIAAPWLWAGGAAVVAGVGAWINGVWGGGDSFAKTKAFFDGCNSEIYKNLKPTLGKQEHRAAAEQIYNAIEGVGTDTQSIKSALASMSTVSDLCAMYKYYQQFFGDLYDDLDSDIDGEDFKKYVWIGIAPQIEDAKEDLEKAKSEEANPETNTAKTDNTIVKTKCPVGNGTRQEVIDFQTYVVNTRKDTTILGRYGANKDGIDGVCGPNTRKAWDKYKSEYENKSSTEIKPDEDEDSIADDNMSDIDN